MPSATGRAEDLGFVADVAVRKEGHEAETLWIVVEIKCGLETLDHHRPAAAVQLGIATDRCRTVG